MVATRPLGVEKLFPAADSDTSMAGESLKFLIPRDWIVSGEALV